MKKNSLSAATTQQLDIAVAKEALRRWISVQMDPALKERLPDLDVAPEKFIIKDHLDLPQYEFGKNCRIDLFEKTWHVRAISNSGMGWNYYGRFEQNSIGGWDATLESEAGDPFRDPPIR